MKFHIGQIIGSGMKYNIWRFVWDTFEMLYHLTGLRWQRPLECFFPQMVPWLFEKMIRASPGKLICNPKEKRRLKPWPEEGDL